MKSRFWSSDWFAGLLITIVVALLSGSAPFQSLGRSFYDWGVRSTDRLPSDKIAVIAIDDESINNIGRWPWPRDLPAELINRLSDGGADELDEAEEGFFGEAETAGRLNHPTIVTIYDAGEEHDLAYIAMEFLKRHDHARYCKPDNLMDMGTVISIVARSAEGLDFTHKQNVVHRDIKPVNIMYEPESDNVKITDFGIARITDSSKTKTGMALGTPSNMSPEQLAGKKVDGRSDLFSLGVMLYQILSGALPFKADSMASLMFKITNEEAADVGTVRAGVPEALAAVINKALLKDVERRYQSGAEFADALKVFLKA